MAVNIASSFKKDEREYNGLESISEALINEPHETRVVVAVVEVVRITKNVADGGTETPTVRFTQIEPLYEADADQARAALRKAYNARTGRPADEQPTLFDGAQSDPAAGPWPGDSDYAGTDDGDASGALKPVTGLDTAAKSKGKP